jgi:hypothetical protein
MPTPTRTARPVCLALLLLTLAGCTATPEQPAAPDASAAATAEQAEPAPAPEPVYKSFPDEALYPLLVAELSARSGHVDVALENYLQQARATRDPGIAAQATRIARYLKNPAAVLEASRIWAEAQPDRAKRLAPPMRRWRLCIQVSQPLLFRTSFGARAFGVA